MACEDSNRNSKSLLSLLKFSSQANVLSMIHRLGLTFPCVSSLIFGDIFNS